MHKLSSNALSTNCHDCPVQRCQYAGDADSLITRYCEQEDNLPGAHASEAASGPEDGGVLACRK